MRGKYAIVVIVSGTLLCFACAAPQANSPGAIPGETLVTPKLFNKITGIQWQLAKMTLENKPIDLVENSKTTFACEGNGRVSGLATINRYSGALKLQPDGEVIWNQAFIMTRMAGPPELMQQEANFTQALMQTSRMFLNDSNLTLRSKDNSTVLEFIRPNNES
jgi:heat shock protein HslJ